MPHFAFLHTGGGAGIVVVVVVVVVATATGGGVSRVAFGSSRPWHAGSARARSNAHERRRQCAWSIVIARNRIPPAYRTPA